MSKKKKAKKPAHGGVNRPKKKAARKKKAVARDSKSLSERRIAAAERHAASVNALVARAPKHPRKHSPATAHHGAGSGKRRSKSKGTKTHAMTLRFTENTLKDIAALECVRRCFR